ncbi:TOBE domain-containing protein [Campylobacter sp. RM12327]|uniref:TOBE domain-containing protein n=1 Tax=Campylobacter sputorum TaxID=206 RepID=UPI000B78FA93|nr:MULTISPECIES: TOBE domain-containing protein [Campylobacter]ASM39608.1 transcriptional regulator, ModE family [Campylobacter sputorum]MBE7358308.1 TOBE domain-containing protein [Campylobacter sp. RM11302]MBF6669470.1 TOBE domain-containing protein [Campylobacter sp. RM12327]MBF6674787.1 TOBE domain-containing protein [Campylobacter sp. RM13538]MBF6676605.1 TOBE domain-containing protein [Campylobacter sp. RM12321]
MELVSNFIIKSGSSDFVLQKRINLLKEIDKTGSILQAAKNIPMSYKAAWDTIDLMNNLSEKPLIERKSGGKNGGGSFLSEYGKTLIKTYENIVDIQKRFLKQISKNVDFDSGKIINLERLTMQISARNVFGGKVESIKNGNINSDVLVCLNGGAKISSTITTTSAQNLGLEVNKDVKVIIKSSSVMIANSKDITISARNIIKGKIINVIKDDISSEIQLDIGGGQILTAIITQNSAQKLELIEGKLVYGVIKSSEVMIGL